MRCIEGAKVPAEGELIKATAKTPLAGSTSSDRMTRFGADKLSPHSVKLGKLFRSVR